MGGASQSLQLLLGDVSSRLSPLFAYPSTGKTRAGRQGILSRLLPPIPYGLFKKNSRLPSAASAY
jgi:hypothetical protein